MNENDRIYPLSDFYGFQEIIQIGDFCYCYVRHKERPSEKGTLEGVLNRRRARLKARIPLTIIEELWKKEGGPGLIATEREKNTLFKLPDGIVNPIDLLPALDVIRDECFNRESFKTAIVVDHSYTWIKWLSKNFEAIKRLVNDRA